MMSQTVKKITLKVEGDEKIGIDYSAAMLSEFIRNEVLKNPKKAQEDFEFPKMKRNTADAVREYLQYFDKKKQGMPQEIRKPFPPGEEFNFKELLKLPPQFNKKDGSTDFFLYEFIEKLSLKDVADLAVAALKLGIPSLFDLCCSKLGEIIRGKRDEEIFREFNFTETFTQEDKESIKNKNKWIQENIYFYWSGDKNQENEEDEDD